MAATRKLNAKKQQQKISVSPIYLMLGVVAIVIGFLGYNVSFFRKSLLEQQSLYSGNQQQNSATQSIEKLNLNALRPNGQATAERKATEQIIPSGNTPQQKSTTTTTIIKTALANTADMTKKEAPKDVDEAEEESYEPITDGIQYQLIFSTGCSAFQDWQSYIFFFHAAKVLKSAEAPRSSMENSHVTRIASGCTPEDAEAMKKLHKEQIEIMSPRKNFHLHLTPDFSYVHGGTKSYKYFNKPYGTKHWMQHALGYKKGEDHSHDNDIVILMDPDQIILRSFSNDFSQHPEAMKKRKSLPNWDRITHGQPFAAHYGFHNQWYSKTNITSIAKKEELPSIVSSMSREMINENFAAGPPYMGTGRDFFKIADKWAEFGVGVHLQYPFLLAEMFAYCLAAAHLNLPHQIVQSFMVSDAGAGGMEAWKHSIDKYEGTDLCTEGVIPEHELPNVLHYCQRYWLGKWFIGKYRLPKDFISCASPLLTVPPDDIALKFDFAIQPGTGEKKPMSNDLVKRNAFMLCKFIPALNEAARFYKQNHCKDDPPNMEETLIFHDSLTI